MDPRRPPPDRLHLPPMHTPPHPARRVDQAVTALTRLGPAADVPEGWRFHCYVCDITVEGGYDLTREAAFGHQHDRLRLLEWNIATTWHVHMSDYMRSELEWVLTQLDPDYPLRSVIWNTE
jgi:hypothetical protein